MQPPIETAVVSATSSAPRGQARYWCPELVSEINVAQPPLSEGNETVTPWDTYSATPASPPPTNTPSSKSTPWSAPAATARPDRPTLEQALDQLRPGDTLVVWKLDRLGRSLRHLVDTVTGLADRGVGFRSLQEAIDTTTPGGKLVFHVFAALAEFERDLIRERTSAGLAAARARGRRGGRPSVLSGHKLQVAEEMYRSGEYSVATIAKTLGVSRASIYRHLDMTREPAGTWVRGGRDDCPLA
jgi:DNA invertase Pin-like site-specific DNA recombinase